jgi:hypothetical protein
MQGALGRIAAQWINNTLKPVIIYANFGVFGGLGFLITYLTLNLGTRPVLSALHFLQITNLPTINIIIYIFPHIGHHSYQY